MQAFPFVFGLFPLLLIVGIIAVVVALARRRGDAVDSGIGTVRRLFYYGLSFVALMVAATGITRLVDYVGDRLWRPPLLTGAETQLAMALALTLVGAPLWLVLWSQVRKAVRQFPEETQALSRKLYLYLILGIAAILVAVGLASLLRWLLGAGHFDGNHLALPLVWGALWAVHWRTETREGQRGGAARSVRRIYVYLISLVGLAMLAVGTGLILFHLLRAVYAALYEADLLNTPQRALWSDGARTAVSVALVGGAYWWWHWHRMARGDTDSTFRQVYLYLFAILGGAATATISLATLLYSLLQWLIGNPSLESAVAHFQPLPGQLAALMIGIGVWGYHWAVVRREAPAIAGGLAAARRVYRYLVAALGLGTLAAGLIVLLTMALNLLVPGEGQDLVREDEWRNPLTLALTLTLVGAPLWGFSWFGIQRDARALGLPERAALSRRVFIFLIFGIAVLMTLGNLSALLYLVLRDLLQGDLSAQVIRETSLNIGMLLTAAAISGYYWQVLQEDRREEPRWRELGRVPRRKAVIAIASEAARPFVRALEARLGFPIRWWQRMDGGEESPEATEEALTAAQQGIAEAPTDQVLLIVDAAGVHVMPYQEG